jgi:hypothetical protein
MGIAETIPAVAVLAGQRFAGINVMPPGYFRCYVKPFYSIKVYQIICA